jgi:hypothetical protein
MAKKQYQRFKTANVAYQNSGEPWTIVLMHFPLEIGSVIGNTLVIGLLLLTDSENWQPVTNYCNLNYSGRLIPTLDRTAASILPLSDDLAVLQQFFAAGAQYMHQPNVLS